MADGLPLDVSLDELICDNCLRVDEPLKPVDGMIREYSIGQGEGIEPLKARVDVRRLKYSEVAPGRYEAQAVFLLCPSCDDPHEVSLPFDQRLPAIVLSEEVRCSRCHGGLFLQNIVDLDFQEGDHSTVDVSARLVCPRCRTISPAEAHVPGVSGETFAKLDAITINASAVTFRDPRPGGRSDSVPLSQTIINEPFQSFPLLLWCANVAQRKLRPEPFANLRVLFVLHLLSDLIPFFRACQKLGIDPKRSVFFVKSDYKYPHREAIEDWLRAEGATVLGKEEIPGYCRDLGADPARGPEKILIVEDGGYIVPELCRTNSPLLEDVIGAVEQTTKGLRSVEDWGKSRRPTLSSNRDLEDILPFPLISIPDSRIKQKVEPPLIANQVVQAIQALTNRIAIQGCRVGLIGLGTIGMEVFQQLRGMGARVTGFEKADESRRTEFVMKGGEVAASGVEAVRGKKLIIGCSGRRSITADEIANIDHGAYLVSASSDRVEIDLEHLEDISATHDRLPIKDDEWTEGKLWAGTRFMLAGAPGKEINLLADGYPVTFWGFPGMPHQGGDMIMAVILMAAAELAGRNANGGTPGLEPFPPGIRRQAVDELGEAYGFQAQYNRVYHPESR